MHAVFNLGNLNGLSHLSCIWPSTKLKRWPMVAGWSLTGGTWLFLNKTFYTLLSTGSTEGDQFGLNWKKPVDWDIKSQNKQKMSHSVLLIS